MLHKRMGSMFQHLDFTLLRGPKVGKNAIPFFQISSCHRNYLHLILRVVVK